MQRGLTGSAIGCCAAGFGSSEDAIKTSCIGLSWGFDAGVGSSILLVDVQPGSNVHPGGKLNSVWGKRQSGGNSQPSGGNQPGGKVQPDIGFQPIGNGQGCKIEDGSVSSITVGKGSIDVDIPEAEVEGITVGNVSVESGWTTVGKVSIAEVEVIAPVIAPPFAEGCESTFGGALDCCK